jgi:hypothetical protein
MGSWVDGLGLDGFLVQGCDSSWSGVRGWALEFRPGVRGWGLGFRPMVKGWGLGVRPRI